MHIRQASEDDAQIIGQVDVAAFMDSGWGQFHHMREDMALQRSRSEESSQYCRDHPDWTFVAIEDDRIVGFLAITYREDVREGEIENMAVLPDYRKRGISTQLARKGIECLRELGAARIVVHTTHVPAALRAYEKVGFTVWKSEAHGAWYEMQVR